MNKKTLKALKGSIEKWERIVAKTGADVGAENCPLCALFNNAETADMCAGCPVMDRTGKDSCSGTPYSDWCHVTTHPYPYSAETEQQVEIAKAELAFLRSLLPPVREPALPPHERGNEQ